MGDELPILKGILNGVVKYHNAPVRFGRVPKREKARILAAMQQSSNSRSHEKAVAAELEDEQRLLASVVRAHLDTCDFTRDKVAPLLARAREQPCYTACPATLACPLNPNTQPLAGQQELLQDFSKRFSPAIRGVVEFAKRIPGFSLLPQDDQVTLLKAGVFEVLLVRLACMFDSQTNSMICLNGQVLRRDAIHSSSNARFLMDSMFDFAERLNALRLSDAEVGLFCAVVVIAPDRPGLRSTDLIERMQAKLRAALQAVVAQNHPHHPSACLELMKKVPDLRTLNTLHSEKLLAFKMTEQQQQQQQQQQHQQQQHLWGGSEQDDSAASASPPASCSWSSGSDAAMDEAVKSPLGSVSSTESLCSGEVAALNASVEFSSQASSAPLLAATLAGGCPMRNRAHSGSSGDEDHSPSAPRLLHHHLQHVSLAPPQQQQHPLAHSATGVRYAPPRRLDSPSDSGIESGPDHRGSERERAQPGSAPTSVCSSPRSSLEDKDTGDEKPPMGVLTHTHHHQHHVPPTHNSHVEDMPVLKRVLQAPPLYDTNSLMDEAYKPHKKFRALRNKDSAEAEAAPQPPTPTPPPVVMAPVPTPASAPTAPATSSLSSTHSTLARSLMEGPRMTAEQRKRTDIIHSYIMRAEASAPAQAPATSSPADFPPTSPPGAYASRLAPPAPAASAAGLLACAPSPAVYHHHHYHHIPAAGSSQSPTPQRWSPAASPVSGVITTTCGRPTTAAAQPQQQYLLSLSPAAVHEGPSSAPGSAPGSAAASPAPADYPRLYFHGASPTAPASACSSGAPSPLLQPHSSTSPSPAATRSPAPSPAPSGPAAQAPAPVQDGPPRLLALQVDCVADSQQPLNLSKKSPSPSPAAVPMEA